MSEQEDKPQQDINQIIEKRRAKLAALRLAGNAFPNDFRRNDLASDLHKKYDEQSNDILEANPIIVRVAGRMMLKRIMGKASFATIQDMSGHIQLYITNDIIELNKWTLTGKRNGPGKATELRFKLF